MRNDLATLTPAPSAHASRFVALRDEFDLATTVRFASVAIRRTQEADARAPQTHTARVAELEATLGTLNRIQEENEWVPLPPIGMPASPNRSAGTDILTAPTSTSRRSFLLDAARRSLDQRPRLALFLERTTSPPREMSPLPDESSRPSHQPTATETRIAGPIPASGREPVRHPSPWRLRDLVD